MIDNSSENYQLSKLKNYIYITIALLFFMTFVFINIFFWYVPMIGILDLAYTIPKIAICSFLISVIFSFLAIRTLPGKILLILNIVIMVFMIFYGM